MSQSDWETDSDYRHFNPGMYAMRQLGRSVSRSTKRLLQPSRTKRNAEAKAPDGQEAQEALDGETSAGRGTSSAAGNGYVAFDFDNDSSRRATAAATDSAEAPPFRRGPPQPSGIHRRSVSFDNLVALPDSIPRRSTEPAHSTEKSPSTEIAPHTVGLPESSTWNSGHTVTKAAAMTALGQRVSSQRPDYVYDATRRKWVPEFAYSPHQPQRVSTSGDGTRISLSARPPSAYWPTDGVVQQAAPHAGGSRRRKGSAAKRARHNRESFSAPSHLDASTHFSESQTSAANASDQFHDHPRMWRNEETPGANINGSDPKEPELLVAAAEISAAAAKADIGFAKQNRQPSNGQASNADPQVLPSMPVPSGLFRKRSAHNQTPASRESSQRKLGNFARVIGNISRRLNRIRSNRSASQPATPAEVRRSILESARQNMLETPEESGHGFYRFVVNPADPVSDADSVEPDSPTISHHPSSARPSRHQRSTSFPSNGVGSARFPFEAGETREADRVSYAGASNSAANAAPANAISYMHNTTAVNINEINSHSSHAEFVQLESIAVSQDATFSTVHMESLRPEAIFQSRLTPRRVSSDSAWLRQAQSRAGSPMNNQGHDGSLSAVVQAKLDSKFIDSVHVSTRLNSNTNTNSSYGTFVRFHNSGELNGIFSTDQEAHPMARDNESILQAQASDASLPEHPSAENISIQQIRQQNAGDNINRNDSDDAASAVGNANANANANVNANVHVEVEHEFSRAPSQAGAAFVSDRRARKQENIRQFVEEMRAAREDSVKRKRDAEMRRQIFNNDQAMLDASVYVYERQQKKVAQDRQRIEQMQQLLEESQLEYLKDKLSERIKQQQLQSQQQRQQLEATHESDTGVAGSSSNTIEPESGGGKCMPPVVFHRGQGGRLRHRRKSEGSGQRNAVVKESGRRRTTMLGLFCAPNDDDAASADTFAHPLPTRLPRKGTAGTLPNSSPFANMAQLHKDLPPLPIARRHNGGFQANGPESENDNPTQPAVSDEQRISPLRKSRSFSHFGSRDEVVVPAENLAVHGHTKDPWTRHSNNNQEAGLHTSSGQIAGSIEPDAKDGAKERRASRAGVLLGVLGLFSSSYARRRSNAHHSAVSQDDQQQHSNAKGGNRRKIALHRGQQQQQRRRRRHTLGGVEADANGNEARLPVLLPRESDNQAPNVHVRVPKESLSNEIYAGFVQSATDDAQSSSRRRMYSHILNTLQGADAQPVVLGPVPRNNYNSQSKADVIQKMSARAEDVDASIKDGADAQLPTSANNGETDADRWRDSAITGLLTQVSAGTSQIRKSMGAEAAYAPEEQNPANDSAQEEAKISESETSSGDDDPLAKQRRYKHVVRFEETAGLKKRTSSLALDTITARTESGELFKQKAKHKKKPMARTTPHSYNASQAVSLDGSIADIASGNTEAYRYNLDLPGLEGVDTPSTNDAMMSPGPSTPRHLPANERLRRLEYEVFCSGKSARSAGSSHDYAHVGRSTSTAVPFDSPVSDSGTGKTQILGFAKANIRANTDTDFTTRYRRPSARPEIRDVRGIAWDDSNPTTTAAESTELSAAGVGLFGGIVSPAVPLVGKNRSALGNRTADTLNTLSGSASQKPAGGTLDGGDSDDDAPLAVGTFPPRFATVATADGLHKSLAKTNDVVAAGDSSQQPVDPALLARLVQTSPDPRNLIYDASSQFGTMRSPKSVGFAVSDSSSVGESNEGRRELLVDIVARIAKHNGGIATQKLQSSEDMANSIEIPVVSKSQSAPSATSPPRNMSAGSHNSNHIRVGDELMMTANSRGRLGLHAAYGDGRSLQRDSDHLETTVDSEVVARASTRAITLFAPTGAATIATAPAAAAVSGASGNDMGIVPSMNQAAEGATDKGVAQHEDSSLAFQEYVEQQRKLPRDRTSHAGMEQLNFRVSLLDRPMPEHNRRSRSVSLPAPQRTASVLENKAWQQRRPSTHQPMDTAEQSFDHYAHHRTKSFYDSSPLVQTLLKPELPPLTATTHSKSQGADEEMADRALFSHLLGDGAALTPSDAQVARRQSTTSSLTPTAPQLFDPIRDTGENGVPDSVLRAYLAGDITAIERFFEHIMRITAPSSVYDGEASEDGDWTYGLEGPPSKSAAKEDADTATKDVFSVSREVPGMIDTSATASNALTSSHNLQQQATAQNSASQTPTETNQGPIAATSDRSLAATNAISVSREHVGPDTSHSANVSPGMRVGSNLPLPYSNLSSPDAVVLQEPVSQQEVLSVCKSEHPSLSKAERVAATAAAATDKPQRKIAIPRPKLSRALNSSESVSESTHAKDASTSIAAQSVLNNVAGTPEAHPLQSWDDSEKFVSSEFFDKHAGRAIDPVVEESIPDDILVSYADNAKCLSPARLPLHSRNHHEHGQVGLSQRKPIPVDGTRSKKQEKQHLLTRLRVLEGMIQKSAIEESRLQPPPALREAQIVKDMESLASIYSSSMELDYDRINMELSRSVRNSANKKQGAAANSNGVTRPLPLSNMYAGSPKAGSEAEQLSAPQPRYINEKGQRAEVLKRLRRNSHARAKSHYRASVLNRQAFVSPGQSAEDMPNKALYTKKWHGKPMPIGSTSRTVQSGRAKDAVAIPNISTVTEGSDATYSARSSGSIRIEIVEEGSFAGAHGSRSAGVRYRQHALPLPSTDRFRRTAKLLT